MWGSGIKAVLFDSGGVLIGPVGGRWNPRFDFEEIVLRRAPHLTATAFADAAAVGDCFLAASDATRARDDYHRAVLNALGVEPTAELLAELDQPLDPRLVVEPYPEVIEVLATLQRRRIRLAVVSDASPNLPDLHAGVGLADYFEAYAISAALGCTKPDPRMYRHVSDAFGPHPGACLFVDDHPPYVEAALELGYRGRAVLRSGGTSSVPTITNLRDLLALLQ